MAENVNYWGRRGGNTWLTAAWVTVTALALLAPIVAMQFTSEVNWTVSDFVFAGAMLAGSGIIYELATRVGNKAFQAAVILALGAAVLIMWTTGAVGVIGSEANPGNLLYVGVVALAIVASIIARGRAAEMVWAMVTVAVATVLVPIVGFAGVADPVSDVLQPEVPIATGVFVAMWLASAWLFRKSAQE